MTYDEVDDFFIMFPSIEYKIDSDCNVSLSGPRQDVEKAVHELGNELTDIDRLSYNR